MNAVYLIGTVIGCSGVGAFLGLISNEGADDLGFGAALGMMYGAIVGGAIGVVIGAVLFT